jgi:hypothetical protein
MSDSEDSDAYEDKNNTTSDQGEANKVFHIKNGKKVVLEEGEVPDTLKEPILFGTEENPKKKKHIINFNKPKDKMVLIEDNGVSELQEADQMLEAYGDPFEMWDKPHKVKKELQSLNLSGWELKYEDLFKAVRNKIDAVIPVINFSSVKNIENFTKLSTLYTRLKDLNTNTILTFSGDFCHGGIYHETSFSGRHIIHLFNQLGVNFMTLDKSDLENPEILERIKEFKGTVILSNVKDINKNKLLNTSGYILRTIKDKSNFENKIAFLGVADSTNFSSSNSKLEISEKLETKLKDKYDFVVVLSSLSLSDNCKLSESNLILAKHDYNMIVNTTQNKIISSDPDLESVTVSLITFPKGSKIAKLQSHLVYLNSIPENPEFIHLQYWKDLGLGELKIKYKFDFEKKFTITTSLLNFLIKILLKEQVNIVMPKIFQDLPIPKNAYDLFTIFPGPNKLVKFQVTEAKILEQILGDFRLIYSAQPSNLIITTLEIAETIITDYVEDLNVTIIGDLKTLLYKNF